MTVPQYANGVAYKKLAALCEAAGFAVAYRELDDDIFARTRDRGIEMPSIEQFETDEHAAMVLGHELGHHLLDDFYSESQFNNPDTNEALRVMIESQCDVVGVILFKLAEMIAGHEAESIFRDIANAQEGGA